MIRKTDIYFLLRKFISLITLLFVFFNQTLPAAAQLGFVDPYETTEQKNAPTQPVDTTSTQDSSTTSSQNDQTSFLTQAATLQTVQSNQNQTVPAQPAVVSVQSGDRRLFVQERNSDGTLAQSVAFVAHGVNWSPTSPGTNPEADPNIFQQEFVNWYHTDLPLMAQMGINVVRVYHDFGTGPEAFQILDEMYRQGIKVIMTVDTPNYSTVASLSNVQTVVNAYKNHPAILMWLIGNEWDLNHYYGKFSTLQQSIDFTEQAAQLIKSLDPNHPVTTILADPHMPGVHPLSQEQFPFLNGPYTSDIVNNLVPSVDVWGLNLYRSGGSFQDVFQQWKSISQKPMYISEFGADSYDHRINAENYAMQAALNGNLWDEAFFDLSAERTNGSTIGALGFEWNDEWWKNGIAGSHNLNSTSSVGQPDGINDEEWFGIVDINRNLKSAYTQLQNRFLNGDSAILLNSTPILSATSQTDGISAKFGIDNKTVFYRTGGGQGGRGINVAILDPFTGIRMQEVRSFDTWASFGGWGGAHTHFQDLINYLNSLPDGTVISLAIADEGGFIDPNSPNQTAWNDSYVEAGYQALEALGSTKIRNVGYQGGWAMIAVKGQGALAENFSPAQTQVTVQTQVSLTLDPDHDRRTNADPTNPSVTPLPLNSKGENPAPAAFADNGTVNFTLSSASAGTLDLNLFDHTSFGGLSISYDDPATPTSDVNKDGWVTPLDALQIINYLNQNGPGPVPSGFENYDLNHDNLITPIDALIVINFLNSQGATNQIETIDLNQAFPNGIVLGLDNGGTGLDQASLEVTDVDGVTASISLTGITATQQQWKILVSQLNQINVNQVKNFSIVVRGQQSNKQLNIEWGNFSVQTANPNPTAIQATPTTLPNHPFLGVFEANPVGQNSTFNQLSSSKVHFNYDVQPQGSFSALSIQFDNFGTGAIETGDLSGFNEIIFGLASNNTCSSAGSQPCLKIEFEDRDGAKAIFAIQGISTTASDFSISKNSFAQFPNFKLNQVRLINFVYDQNLTQTSTRTGFLDVTTGGLFFIPQAEVTTDPVTDLSSKKPLLGELEPCATAGQNPCTSGRLNTITSISQDSAGHFQFNFNLGNGSDGPNDFRRYGGAFLNFGSTPWDPTTPVVLGLKATGTSQLHLEFSDITGKVVKIYVNGLSSTFQKYKITKDLLDAAGTPGFDSTKIKSIDIVVDEAATGSKTSQGVIEVNTQGLFFTPFLSPDSTKTAANVSSPAGIKNLVSFDSNTPSPEGTVTLSQLSGSRFNLNYDLTNAGSFGGSISSFDDFSTLGKEFQNLTGQTLIFGLKDAGVPTAVTLQLEDASGQKDQIILNGVDGTERFFSVDTALFDGINLNQVTGIVFILEQSKLTDPTSTLEVRLGGHPFIPTATPDPTKTAADVSSPIGIKNLVGFDSNPPNPDATLTFTQASSSRFNLDYNLTPAGSFVGSITSFDDFSTVAKETKDLSNTSLVFGLKDAGAPSIVLQLEDATGKKDQITLSGIDGTERFFNINTSVFDNVDLTQITGIIFVVEQSKTTDPTSTLEVRLGGHPFVPAVSPDATKTAADTTALGGVKTLSSFDSNPPDPNGTVTLNQLSGSRFNLAYDLTNAASFGGSITSFDDFATGPKEFQNLTGQTLIFGLKDAGAPTVTLQLEDAAGNKDQVVITGVDGAERFFSVDTSLFDGVNLSQITGIIFLLEQTKTTDPTSTLEVRLGGHPFIPTIQGTNFDEAQITTLANTPNVIVVSGNSAVVELHQLSSSEFEYQFDLQPSATSFSAITIAKPGALLSLPQDIVLAVRGHEGQQVLVEITDTTNRKASFMLVLHPVYQNYTLSLSGANIPAGFDRTSVAAIVFVEDRTVATALDDLAQVKIKGLDFIPTTLPLALETLKSDLIQDGLSYFQQSVGVDPATHFPYDSVKANSTVDASNKFTQPTLIGFYLQLLGDVVNVKSLGPSGAMTQDEALTEIDTVLTSLLNVQTQYGWNGLLPWFDLDPVVDPAAWVGLGDNANLAQSLAVMMGSLDGAPLTPAQRTAANAILAKADQFLNNQAPGYAAFVDPTFGIFRSSVDRASGVFDNYIDRLASEFRGAVAFLKVRYPSLPDTVWTNLVAHTKDYIDQVGAHVENLAYYDGSAFQAFWPNLRNDERDFVGFRNALYNAFVSFLDYSAQNRIPGILSASQRPNGVSPGQYYGRTGIRQIAESGVSHADQYLIDVGSTYALASALSIDPLTVLSWLNAIKEQLPSLSGNQGFLDSARSDSEIAHLFLGIDVASTILGLANTGPAAFETYLKNRNLELSYNLLYDTVSQQLGIGKTTATLQNPPEFPDRSRAVFSHFSAEGSINSFPINPASFTGVHFTYGALAGGFGGQFWVLDQNYDAQANQLVIHYSVNDSPQSIKIELKDDADNLIFSTTENLVNSSDDQRLVINLPNQAIFATLRKVFIVIDQNATGDTSGDFAIRAIDFQHLPSSQNLQPDAGLGPGDVTNLPGNPPAQLFSSNPASTLDRPAPNFFRLNFNVTNPGDFAGVTINFDPTGTTNGADLSGFTRIVFGTNSSQAKKVKLEIEDAHGNRATLYIQNIDVARNYYEFLRSMVSGSVDFTQVKKMNVVVDQSSVNPGDEIGSLEFEINGLQP